MRRADVYQNYAELELTDIRRSGELLSKLDNKLDLRKFEVVEPSLNSIFINVVGQIAPAPEPPSTMSAGLLPSKPPMDSRVKRSLISLVMAAGVTIVLAINAMISEEHNWGIAGIMLVATLFSAYQFFREREKAETARRLKKQEGRR
ncbi:MAG TPA: hypothetical protein DCP63_01120 [Bacteroidetes bacterium]|nr:hypothetical protein [Bacteroidota bacterium]